MKNWSKKVHVQSSLESKPNQYAMFIGRWQPLHDGHKALFQQALNEGKNVWIAIRDVETTESNPFNAQEVLENILPFPFKDSNLNNPELSERLAIDDSASADKFQIVCISVALFLIKRAVREALYDKFGTKFDSMEGFNHLAIQANEIANNIIAQQLKAGDFPSYVDLQYLLRWDRRYHEAAADSRKTNLLEVILHSALRHATFSYEDEDAVVAADDMMFIEFNRIFDAYLIELRNMLGDSCLR